MTARARSSSGQPAAATLEDHAAGEDPTLLVDALAGGARVRRGVRTVVAVIPAYNEGLVIGSVVLQARQHADRVIVVDDGSSDRTAAIARLAGADVIEMPENGGKAKAARSSISGFWRA